MLTLGRFFAATLALASLVSPTQSAYMLGNPGWEPLTLDYLKAHNIDPSFMDEVLDGGGEFTCLRPRPDGKIGMTTLSAWFVDGDRTHVITNAHILYSAKDGLLKSNFEDCFVMTNREALESDKPARIPVDPDLSRIMIGAEDPLGDFFDRDRALVPLISGKKHKVKPIELQSGLVDQMVADKKVQSPLEVFMVSSGRNVVKDPWILHISPKIQAGAVWRIDTPSDPDQPARVLVNVDWHAGDSASLLFVRDSKHPTKLLPFAMFRGGRQGVAAKDGKVVDGLVFDPVTNNANAILLDGNFMNFPLSVEQVPKSALPSKIDQNPK